jgi:hypothetical protein
MVLSRRLRPLWAGGTAMVLGALLAAGQAQARDVRGQVEVVNRTYATSCAEEDNVDLEFQNRNIAGFVIRATQPAYIHLISSNLSKPDFRGCSFGHDERPVRALPPPEKVVIYDSPEIRLIGLRLPNFWRPADVPFIVGNRRETGLQLVQLWVKHHGRADEVIAFYPSDGYWRLRPLPFGPLRLSSYGSSIVIGPVARSAKRPYVALKDVSFDPSRRSFRIDFLEGGAATLTLQAADHRECALSVMFSGKIPAGRPFAAVRSMFVSASNADASAISWEGTTGGTAIPAFHSRRVSSLWIGRHISSMHNNSAPDLSVSDFILNGR